MIEVREGLPFVDGIGGTDQALLHRVLGGVDAAGIDSINREIVFARQSRLITTPAGYAAHLQAVIILTLIERGLHTETLRPDALQLAHLLYERMDSQAEQ